MCLEQTIYLQYFHHVPFVGGQDKDSGSNSTFPVCLGKSPALFREHIPSVCSACVITEPLHSQCQHCVNRDLQDVIEQSLQ